MADVKTDALRAEQRRLRQIYGKVGPKHWIVNRLEELYAILDGGIPPEGSSLTSRQSDGDGANANR